MCRIATTIVIGGLRGMVRPEHFPTAWGHPVWENASLAKLPERVP
jgi:hypothetical protein